MSGDLTGTVTDSTGAVIPNTTVTLKSSGEGTTQTTATNQNGNYRFTLLKPGTYIVSATAANMAQVSRQVEVQVGQVTTASILLGAQGTEVTIEVTAEAPLLQTENSNLATTYDSKQIALTPNPGGDQTFYAQTAPGVAMNVGGAGGGVGNFTAYGLPATSNLFTVNGNDNNDPFLNLNNSGASNLLLGSNELQEISVVTTGYTAQYGRQAGVQVDSTTKSGNNALHGNANYYWNGRTLNANDWFNNHNGSPRPFANNNQWSASFGGPIIKNKTFFFVDTEGLRYILPSGQRIFVPSPQFEQAILNNLSANNAASVPFYNQMFALYNATPGYSSFGSAISQDPNTGCGDFIGAGFGGGAGQAPCLLFNQSNGKNLNKEYLVAVRIDQNIGSRDKLFGRFHLDHGQQPTTTDIINNKLFGVTSIQPTYDGQLNETHLFGANMLNQLVVSGMWYSAVFNPNSGPAARLAALPFATVNFNGPLLTDLGGTAAQFSAANLTANFPQGRNVTQYQVLDDFSINHGNHTFKMGGNFRRNDISDYGNSVFTLGEETFGSVNDFFNGLLNGANNDAYFQTFTTHPRNPLAIYSAGVYFQDEVRVTPSFKLTLAIRADRNSNAVCQNDCFARLANPFDQLAHAANIPYNQAIRANQQRAFQKLEKAVLQPRFGITWSPFGLKDTVVRGGFGVFSDLYQGVLVSNIEGNSPTPNTFNIAGTNLVGAPAAPGVTVNGVPDVRTTAVNSNAALVSAFNSGATLAQIQASNPFFAAPSYYSTDDIRNPKYLKWNLEVQQGLGSKMSLDVNYVGTHGYDELIVNPDANAFTTGGLPFVTTAPDARFGQINLLSSSGISNYNGLTTTLTRRAGYGFSGSVSYTWSHALDELTSLPNTPFNAINSVTYQLNPTNLRQNYGNSDGDLRHNLTANYVWEMPFKFQNHILNTAAAGWSISGVLFARSGQPYSAIDPGAPLTQDNPNFGILAQLLPGQTIPSCSRPSKSCLDANMFVHSGTETSFGTTARNSFHGPSYFDTDFSIAKNFSFQERARFSIGANFFNVLNHPHFAVPIFSNINSGNFGQIIATAPQPTSPYGAFQTAGVTGRIVQIVGKLSF